MKLLRYWADDADEAKNVDAVLGALKSDGYLQYKQFKEAEGEDVKALADTVRGGAKVDIRTLHEVLNKKLPPLPPNVSKHGGAGTQYVHPILRGLPASQQASTDPVKMTQAKDALT